MNPSLTQPHTLLMLNSTVIRFSFLVNQTEATETTGGEGGDIRVHDTAA
jgi:hypothetical protein